jgi:hypothetical protein
MKEDILEQLVDDYLQHQGYFTRHNIKFRPSYELDPKNYDKRKDSVHSDLDVIGINPNLLGVEKVVVVTCKSWQKGLTPSQYITAIEKSDDHRYAGKPAWKHFRELTNLKWANAFNNKITEITGSRDFTYILAVTKLNGDRKGWENYPRFKEAINGNPLKIITVNEIICDLYPKIGTVVSSTEIGRLLQIIKASGWEP